MILMMQISNNVMKFILKRIKDWLVNLKQDGILRTQDLKNMKLVCGMSIMTRYAN